MLTSYDQGGKHAFFAGGGKDGLFIVSKDAARFVSNSGAETLNRQFDGGRGSLKNPQIAGAGGYIAVYETGSPTVYVCGQTGKSYAVTAAAPVYNASVNGAGWLCLLMNTQIGASFEIYNQNGDLAANGEFTDSRVIPVCAAVSADGRVAAVAFADVSGTTVSSGVNFYYVNKKEASTVVNGLFAFSGEFEGSVIGEAVFFGGALICAADNSIIRIDLEGEKAIKTVITFDEKITALSIEDAHAAVALESGVVKIYDAKLKQTGEYITAAAATFLACGHGKLAAGAGGTFAAVTYGGIELWKNEVTADVKSAYITDTKTLALCGGAGVSKVGVE